MLLDEHTIHEKEILARRALGKDSEVFEKDNIYHYKLTLFMDRRPGGISVDRFGLGEPNKKIVAFLNGLGIAFGERIGKEFRGWATFRAFEFRKIVSPTPAEGEENPYHAEIMKNGHEDTEAQRSLAFRLCVEASSVLSQTVATDFP
jgi:hypothetical protein